VDECKPLPVRGLPAVRGLPIAAPPPGNRGLHSSTSQLNVSAFRGIGGAFRGYVEGDEGFLGGIRGVWGIIFVFEKAQFKLRSGRG
jgi:hypothetical protein